MRSFILIYAKTIDGGIGLNGEIPWKDKCDLEHFKKITTGHIVIMGRKTYSSLPIKPLPDRINIIIGSNFYCSFEDAMEECYNYINKKVFIIGGAQLFNYVIKNYPQKIDGLYITLIKYSGQCQVYINDKHLNLDNYNVLEEKYTKLGNRISICIRKNVEELKYLEILKEIRDAGNRRNDRTGVGTYSLFAKVLSFNLRDGTLPLFTTKKLSFKLILTELIWFIKGEESTDFLHEHGCHIWDQNVESNNGELGPMYPVQWRSRGLGKIDQLTNMISLISYEPDSRRILIDNYDVENLHKMCIHPCHIIFQVYVAGQHYEELEGLVILRSSDTVLGLCFNICSYSLLLHMLAHITRKKATKLTVMLGDTHIYLNHMDAVEELINREPKPFPNIKIDECVDCIDDFKHDHFKLFDYVHCQKLNSPTPMAK